ncbi:MAG TPA: LysM peptidoglycan-binding domain-containing protein [Desulfovibrio sp.]|uniref:LysM peptidoglycan-binding domain-containing protein n=1 Tax=Desulfovibrio sp. TaxID=885 RepID=UPI002C16DF2E|nr:LysM peptidoglycan-binding domain-containing protein [Desulfovibrio sp.]HMM39630.1 LysM peptidoglycan-binding domain-containing protein [Desulfovibrio sp.]
MQHRMFPRTAQALLILVTILVLASCAARNPATDKPAPTAVGPACVYPRDPLDKELDERPREDLSVLTPAEREALGVRTGIDFDLDTMDTEEVQQYFAFFTHRARGTFQAWLGRSEAYLPAVRAALIEHGLPQDLALLPYAESGYNPNAVSRAGAVGMWQFMRGTARKYGLTVDWWIDERRDPALSTQAAARYLSDLYGMFGDWYLALAAYNAGEGKISNALEKTNANDFFDLVDKNDRLRGRAKLREETRHYVPKFIAISKIFQNLDMLGFQCVDWKRAPRLADVNVPGGSDLMALAQAVGLSWNQFREYNPAFLRQVSPPGMSVVVHVPESRLAEAKAYLQNPKSRPYAGYTVHTVRGSDSLWKISRRYGVPVAVIKRMNNLSSGKLVKGQQLLVPGGGSARELADEDRASSRKTRKLAQARSNYIVQKDDTLWSISRQYGLSVATLQQANGLSASSKLSVGQRLFIPDQTGKAARQSRQEAEAVHAKLADKGQEKSKAQAKTAEPKSGKTKVVAQAKSTSYKVREGDTLYSIARRFNVSLSELLRWNSLNNGSTIHAGQEIKVLQR